MEKEARYLEHLLDQLESWWEQCRSEAEQARTWGDEEGFREWRIRLGAVARSTLLALNGYREVYGDHPTVLAQRIDSLMANLRTESNVR